MNYLEKNNKNKFVAFLIDIDKSSTKSDINYFPVFTRNILQIREYDKQRYLTNYWWQKLFSREAKRQYNNELLQKQEFLSINQSIYNEAFNYIISEITPLQPNDLSIKITASNSLYLKFEIENKHIIRLEVFLDDQDVFSEESENTSLIIEKNKSQIYGCFASPTDALRKLKNYFMPDTYSEKSKLSYENSILEEEEYSLTT